MRELFKQRRICYHLTDNDLINLLDYIRSRYGGINDYMDKNKTSTFNQKNKMNLQYYIHIVIKFFKPKLDSPLLRTFSLLCRID